MPSPFVGMNPYLEDPALWPGVHASLIAEMRNAINARIPDKYFADVEERVYLCESDDPSYRLIIPDVAVREAGERGFESLGGEPADSAGVATAIAPVRAPIMLRLEHTERRLVIQTVQGQRVITVIEVVSPSNKVVGSAGRRTYVEKRDEMLNSDTHFIEIDLLRAGERIPAEVGLRKTHYRIAVSRTQDRPNANWWLFNLPQRIPQIPVPLGPGDEDVTLDLQAVLPEVYDRGRYVRRLNYAQPPPPPEFGPVDGAWLQAQLDKLRSTQPS